MKFRVLGALEALTEGGALALGGVKPRAVLAYLLLHPNQPVSADRLALALWGEDAPPAATKTVQVHVSRLRKALGDPALVTTVPGGYRLTLGPDDLDADRFQRLAARGRELLGAGDAAGARTLLVEALALWRGPALADLTFEPFARAEIDRLEEQRLAALETRIDADLAAGGHAAIVGELAQLVATHPLRERLAAQLMLALYRCGRQAESLAAYARTRAHQTGELGLEPGPELKTLQAQILEQSPELDLAPAAQAPSPGPPPTPAAAVAVAVGPAARTRRPIVGRGGELDELRAALVDARAGHGGLFLLLGEAGIGKTRLAEALVDEAVAGGDDVLWGGAWEAGGAAAYWPWTQVIRQLLDSRSPADLLADLGAGGPYVAQIAPEVGRLLGSSSGRPPPSLESEAARFGAFDAIASFLRAAAARRPILLVLDDLHAADVATLRLLEFVARGLRGARILAVSTYRTDAGRDDAELAGALADLSRPARPLTLTGLSRDEVLELAAAQTDQPLPGRVVDRVYALTEGNPLFVDEVMRLLGAQGLLATPGALGSGRLPVPAAVRETIGSRLEPLPAEVVGALRAAAVIGSSFRLVTLVAVLGVEPAAALALLDAGVAAGLVVPAPGSSATYRFAHALARETVYEGLGAHQRAELHGRVGEALLAIHGERDAPLSELAHHFIEAAAAGDDGRAVSYAAAAGEDALKRMAYEQAIDLFSGALRTLELRPAEPATRGPILLALGQAEMRAGSLEASRATLRRAADDARRLGDGELLGRAALASAPLGLATGLADEEDLIPLIREALELLPSSDSALRAQLTARLATARYWSSTPEYREALTQDAIAMARRVGDPATLAFVLSDGHRATWSADSADRALPWASEIYAVAERIGNMELALIAHGWRISLLIGLGEITIVDREIETFQRAAARLHQPRAQCEGLLHACARSIIAGRFTEAEELLGEASGFAALLAQDPLLTMRLSALAFVMREVQGRLGELEAAVRHFADSQPAFPVWRCALVCVYLQAGRPDDLRREYDRLVADGFDALPRDNLWLPALALLAEACAFLGEAAHAAQLRTLLAPYHGRAVVTPDGAYLGPVDRYLALLAATAGDPDAAARWLASARSLAARMGAGPTLVRLTLDEAGWLVARDPAGAAALAADAAGAADALGLERLAERARAYAAAPA